MKADDERGPAGTPRSHGQLGAKAVANFVIPKSRMCGPQVRFCERGPRVTGGPYLADRGDAATHRTTMLRCAPRLAAATRGWATRPSPTIPRNGS